MKSQHLHQDSQPIVDVVSVTTDLNYEVECQAALIQLATYTRQWRQQLAVRAEVPVERSYQVTLNEATEPSTIHLLSESASVIQVIREEEVGQYVLSDFDLESGVVRQGNVATGDDLDHALVVTERDLNTVTTMIDTARIVYACFKQEKRKSTFRTR